MTTAKTSSWAPHYDLMRDLHQQAKSRPELFSFTIVGGVRDGELVALEVRPEEDYRNGLHKPREGSSQHPHKNPNIDSWVRRFDFIRQVEKRVGVSSRVTGFIIHIVLGAANGIMTLKLTLIERHKGGIAA